MLLKGKIFEQQSSKLIHLTGLPVLVSPLLLRDKNLGQIDVCILKKNQNQQILQIIEIKSISYPDKNQTIRLIKSANYLANLLEIQVEVKVRLCQKRIDSLFY